MEKILNKLIENIDFAIYGSQEINVIGEEVLAYLSCKKQELMNFFQFSSFSQVQIGLFKNREDYEKNLNQSNPHTICCCYSNVSQSQLFTYLKRSLSCELVRLMYSKIYKNRFARSLWIEEGLVQYLSGEKDKLLKSAFNFREFYFDRIVRRDKELPPIQYLKQKGYEYGKFMDSKTNKYDGYAISYLLIHYLVETKSDIYSIITNEEKIKEIEKTLLEDCIKYYNQKYPVKNNFYDIKTDGELMDYMNKNIVYGWLDSNKNEHIDTLKNFREEYRTSSIQEILTTKLAVCIGQAKLIQYWFQMMGIENKLFCFRNTILENNTQDIQMHCFVLFHNQEYWYHFEHSAQRKRGIYRFETLEEAIDCTAKKFLTQFELKELIEIPFIPDGLTYDDFNDYLNQFERYEFEKGQKR